MRLNSGLCLVFIGLAACSAPEEPAYVITVKDSAGKQVTRKIPEHTPIAPTDGTPQMNKINTGSTTPAELVAFARTATGIPYQYGSTDPSVGFDCSGFITYVFNHFGIAVPRSSVDFTHVSREVPVGESRPGDLILFTGTNPSDRTVGHMGIVVSPAAADTVKFIHATSGKAKGVVETPLTSGYVQRFVKVLRIFK
ncbi:hypothetical protein A0256_06950 [Mucilaginibacter sp. PAMC 26640]|nr:hypothetical protein A0256_06950 [Mucilaginibacter sp. PAMC 26640]